MSESLTPLTFPPNLYKKLVPSQFLSRHLQSSPSTRPDSRHPQDFRDFFVTCGSLGSTRGSSVVRLGGTIMTCGIRAEVAEPDPFAPRDGYMVPNIEIGPLCHSALKAGPPSDLQQTIAFKLAQTLQTVNVVDTKDLCIEAGKAVWVLYIDIICLSHTGSLFTTANAAMIAALSNTSLYAARWDTDTNSVKIRPEASPIMLHTIPHVLEFGVFDRIILADLTDEEEKLCTEILRVTMDANGNVLELTKSGGSALGAPELVEVLELAHSRVKLVDDIMRQNQKHKL